jgi:serine/threonine-protein kinase RsbW
MAQRVEAAPPNRIRTPQAASVVLTVPAYKDYVVIIRSAVAQLGACFGFTIREVTDLRLAVNEACALLVAGRPGADRAEGVIECRAVVRGDVLRVTVAAPAGGFDTPDTDGLGWNIMAALVDTLTWAQDGVTARVALEKRRGSPGG